MQFCFPPLLACVKGQLQLYMVTHCMPQLVVHIASVCMEKSTLLKALSCSAPRDQEALFCSKLYSGPDMLSSLVKTCHKHLACPK